MTVACFVATFAINAVLHRAGWHSGLALTVGFRRWPRSDDRPQTVWQVQLPGPLTFREYPDGSWVDGPTLWYAQESLTRTGVSPRRVRAVAARLVASVAAPAVNQR